MTRFGFAAAMMMFLSGCVSNYPTDIELTSVEAANERDQDEILKSPEARSVLGLPPDSSTGDARSARLFLKVEFTSAVNLSKFTTDNSYPLGHTSYFCDTPKDPKTVRLHSQGIYWRGQNLGLWGPDPIESSLMPAGSPITYYIFINTVDEATWPSYPPRESYDLRQQAKDICFYLAGGAVGFGYKSNIVVVPKSKIEAALQTHAP